MRRRNFIGLLGGAAMWPLVARAQQTTRAPTIGFLLPGGSRTTMVRGQLEVFRQALKRSGPGELNGRERKRPKRPFMIQNGPTKQDLFKRRFQTVTGLVSIYA